MTSHLPITGPPAQDGDFFGREQDLARLWAVVEQGHLLLLAPRRVGKTSVLKQMRAAAPRRHFHAVYTSVAHCTDELAFVQTLYAAAVELDGSFLDRVAASAWARTLKSLLPIAAAAGPVSVTFPPEAAGHWAALGEALVRVFEASPQRTLFIVDELPLVVSRLLEGQDARRARLFLEWFRDVRQRLTRVHWALAGSVGLDSFTEQWGLTATINDLTSEYLGAFDEHEAPAFLRWSTARAGLPVTDDVLDHLLDCVGWPIPFFLAHMVRELARQHQPGRTLTRADVEAGFERLTDVHHRHLYHPWHERLALQLTPDRARVARQILSLAARRPSGVSHRVLSAAQVADPMLLATLEADGYLVPAAHNWRFRSPLLRTYWQRYLIGRTS